MDLSRILEAQVGVSLAERSVGAVLNRLGFRRIPTRPRHLGHDADTQEDREANFAALVAASILEHARDKPIE